MKIEVMVSTERVWDKQPNAVKCFDAEPVKDNVRYTLTTDHSQSSYGMPVLVAPDGVAYGPSDKLPNTCMTAGDAVLRYFGAEGIVDPTMPNAVDRFVELR